MRLLAIALRELRALLGTPLAWFLLAVLQFICAWIFFVQLDAFAEYAPQLALLDQGPGLTDVAVAPLLASAGFLALFLAPLLTMRLISEERRAGTLVLLLAAPVSSTEIVLGKFLGLLGFFTLVVATTALMPLSLLAGASLDLGQLACGLLGLWLLLGSFGAAGLYFSTLTAQPALAAVGSFGLLLFFYLADLATESGQASAQSLFRHLSLAQHLEPLLRGLFSTGDVAYFLVLTGLFLALSVWKLDADRQGR